MKKVKWYLSIKNLGQKYENEFEIGDNTSKEEIIDMVIEKAHYFVDIGYVVEDKVAER